MLVMTENIPIYCIHTCLHLEIFVAKAKLLKISYSQLVIQNSEAHKCFTILVDYKVYSTRAGYYLRIIRV